VQRRSPGSGLHRPYRRPARPAAELDEHLTTTVTGQWVVWARKLARPKGDLFVPLTGGPGYPADARAECRFRGVRSAHDAPDPGCTCGFHALSSRRSGPEVTHSAEQLSRYVITAGCSHREIRRYGRHAGLLLDVIHGGRTRRSGRGLHSRLASDTA
jgi:hypothetical protein